MSTNVVDGSDRVENNVIEVPGTRDVRRQGLGGDEPGCLYAQLLLRKTWCGEWRQRGAWRKREAVMICGPRERRTMKSPGTLEPGHDLKPLDDVVTCTEPRRSLVNVAAVVLDGL